MKILAGIDVPFHPFGGSLMVANDWYTELAKDHEVLFITLPPTDPQYQNWSSIPNVRFLEVEKVRGEEAFPSYTQALQKEVEKIIEEFQPDIIHAHHLNYGLSRVFADIRTSAKKLGICHGTDVQLASTSNFWLQNMKVIANSMDAILFPNENMRDDFFKYHKTSSSIYIQSYGIPDSAFAPQGSVVKIDSILYAGRLLHWKGPDIAAEAMKYTQGMNLDIIGNEDQAGFQQKIIDIIKENQLEKVVNLYPQIDREELWERMNNYQICALPSRSLEALSLVALEAQARGVVLVYAPGGGIEKTIAESGYKVSENTPEEFAKAFMKLKQDHKLFTTLQEKGYRNAEQYKLSHVIKQIEKINHQVTQS